MTLARRLLGGIVTLLAGVAILVVLAAGALLAAGYRFEPVLSGSMVPLMPVGSLVVVKTTPARDVRVGDVVTFRHPLAPSSQITHRVVRIDGAGADRRFHTKGDALAHEDPWAVALPGSVGRRVATIPYLGAVAGRLSGGTTLAAIVALTAILFLAGILRSIWAPTAPAPSAARDAGSERRAGPTAYGTPW